MAAEEESDDMEPDEDGEGGEVGFRMAGGGAGPETDHARHDAERWRASAAAAGRGAASSGRAASCPALAMVARASRASETSCRAHSCIDAIDHVKESTLRARGLGNVES